MRKLRRNNKVLKGLLYAGIAAASVGTLAGCGASDSGSATTAATTTTASSGTVTTAATTAASTTTAASSSSGGKEITIAIYRDGEMNELDAATYKGPHVIYKMIYEGFTEDGGKEGILPLLAESWDISEDGKTYTFHLRKGVTYTDGTPLDAESVIFNLKRWTNNDRHSSLTSYQVDDMKAIDDHTVAVTFTNNAYPIITEMSYPRPNRFLSPASIKDNGEVMGEFTSPVGTGQWMLDSYTQDEGFVLKANPDYWGEKPALEKINFKVIKDGQARVMALQSGEVDVIGGDLLGKIPMEGLQELKNQGYTIYDMDTMCAYYMAFNQTNEIFNDVKLRQALNMALDKETMVSSLFYGVGEAAKGLYNSRITPYVTEENSPGYKYDAEKAKSLLAEAGYADTNGNGTLDKDGKELELTLMFTTEEFPEFKTIGEYVQSEFSKIGVKVNINTVDTNTFNEHEMAASGYDLIINRTSSDSWVPHGDMKQLFSPLTTADGRAKLWLDDELTGYINETLVSHDESSRQAGYDKIFKRINDEAFVIPLYYPKTCFAVSDNVSKFDVGVNNYAPINWTTLDVK